MEAPTAWFCSCGDSGPLEADVLLGLDGAGIQIVARERTEAPAPFGIVCFREVTEELFRVLHATRLDGNSRIVALALPETRDTPPVWRLLHAGAADVLVWDRECETAKQVRAKLERWSTVHKLADEASARESLIGQSRAWRNLVCEVVEIAHYSRAPVLLTGESGTGKEMLARVDKQSDMRRQGRPAAASGVGCGRLRRTPSRAFRQRAIWS